MPERVPARVLVRAPNWTGDLVMATPGFRALRAAWPTAHLALHAKPALLPLLGGTPWFDELIPLVSSGRGTPALVREGRALRSRRFELGVCLPDSFSSALLMRCAGVSRVWGYATQGRRALLHAPLAPPAGWVPREKHVLDLVVAAAGGPPQGTHLELFVTDEEERVARAVLRAHAIEPGDPLALLAPGASYGPAKLWPAASFARVADALAAAGARIALLGAPDEAPLVRRVAAAMHAPAAELAGRLDLGALKAVLRRARVLVCNDAGSRHIAVAFGVPVVTLLGPTSLAKTSWNLERVRALSADVGCRPCYHRVCPIDHRCMARLDPERVLAAALPALTGERREFRGDGALRLLPTDGTALGDAAPRRTPAPA